MFEAGLPAPDRRQVGKDVGQVFVGQNLAENDGMLLPGGLPDVGAERRVGERGRRDARRRGEVALAERAVTLVATVAHERRLAVNGVSGRRGSAAGAVCAETPCSPNSAEPTTANASAIE